MRKKTFLKAVCIFTCLSIFMLSVPGAIASERTDKKTYTTTYRLITMLSSFLPFLNLNVNNDKGDTSSGTISKDDLSKKIRITGTLSLVHGPKRGH